MFFTNLNAHNNAYQSYFIGELEELEVIDSLIFQELDATLYYSAFSPYLVLKKNILFKISFDHPRKESDICENTPVVIETFPHSVRDLFLFREDQRSQKGFLYYKNNLVIIEDFAKLHPKYFKQTGKTKQLYYNGNFYMDIGAVAAVEKYFCFIDDILTIVDYCGSDDKNKIENTVGMHYIVEDGDSWESIANELTCSVSDLINPSVSWMQNIPDIGYMIIVDFTFHHNKLVSIKRIQ